MIATALVCLTAAVYYEARGEPIEGQRAVAQVVLNRAHRDPALVCEVVYARGQFSWTAHPPLVANAHDWHAAQAVARDSFKRSDFTHGATHFHGLAVNPRWAWSMDCVGRYGNHLFFRRVP